MFIAPASHGHERSCVWHRASAGRNSSGEAVAEGAPAPARLRSDMLDNLAQGNGLRVPLRLSEDPPASQES